MDRIAMPSAVNQMTYNARPPTTPTGGEQGGRFRPGQSGNPRGRARGSRNKTTLAIEALLEGQAEALTQKAIERALQGDMVAIRLCLDRIAPPRRDRLVEFDLPPIATAADALACSRAVLAAVAVGKLTPFEGAQVSALITAHVKLVEIVTLEERVAFLEQARAS